MLKREEAWRTPQHCSARCVAVPGTGSGGWVPGYWVLGYLVYGYWVLGTGYCTTPPPCTPPPRHPVPGFHEGGCTFTGTRVLRVLGPFWTLFLDPFRHCFWTRFWCPTCLKQWVLGCQTVPEMDPFWDTFWTTFRHLFDHFDTPDCRFRDFDILLHFRKVHFVEIEGFHGF